MIKVVFVATFCGCNGYELVVNYLVGVKIHEVAS